MRRLLAFTSDHHDLDPPPGHPFPAQKYALLREAVARDWPTVRLQPAPAATDGELALVHVPAYIAAVSQGTLTPAQQREIGFPWSPRVAERSRRSVGATIAAARAALEEGVAANLAGGTHHAYADKGSGYCVYNDVAVAARLMQAEWSRRHRTPLQVLVIDLDVQLDDGCDDLTYLDQLDRGLDQVWARTAAAPPGLVFYLAGADPHEGDRLGRLRLSAAGLAERDRRVLEALRLRGWPVALSMAGGYGHDIGVTVGLQSATIGLALQSWQAWRHAGSARRGDGAGMEQSPA